MLERIVLRPELSAFEKIIARFGEMPVFNPKDFGFYQDWERTALYKVERGEGECAM